MAELGRFLRNERRFDLHFLGVAALDPLIHDAEHRVADLHVIDAGTERADDAGKIAAEDIRKFELARGAVSTAAEAHLVIGGVDARGMDIDDDLAGARDRVRRVAINELLRSAMLDQQYRLHDPSSARLFIQRRMMGRFSRFVSTGGLSVRWLCARGAAARRAAALSPLELRGGGGFDASHRQRAHEE
jgi:hypothetical protein